MTSTLLTVKRKANISSEDRYEVGEDGAPPYVPFNLSFYSSIYTQYLIEAQKCAEEKPASITYSPSMHGVGPQRTITSSTYHSLHLSLREFLCLLGLEVLFNIEVIYDLVMADTPTNYNLSIEREMQNKLWWEKFLKDRVPYYLRKANNAVNNAKLEFLLIVVKYCSKALIAEFLSDHLPRVGAHTAQATTGGGQEAHFFLDAFRGDKVVKSHIANAQFSDLKMRYDTPLALEFMIRPLNWQNLNFFTQKIEIDDDEEGAKSTTQYHDKKNFRFEKMRQARDEAFTPPKKLMTSQEFLARLPIYKGPSGRPQGTGRFVQYVRNKLTEYEKIEQINMHGRYKLLVEIFDYLKKWLHAIGQQNQKQMNREINKEMAFITSLIHHTQGEINDVLKDA
jgi:hypothetical protein